MSEQDIFTMIEKTVNNANNKSLEKIQYIMDFGEVTVQYDFCLN